MMFLKAIDLLFERITASSQGKKLLSQTVAISGAAQQHATVYWSHQAETALGSLKPSTSLAEQLSSAFSLQTSPNWQDSSTTTECREMESLIGGEIELASRTGSRAHERFSGPQIMKVRKHQPDVYSRTSRISLVSSFLTTILCGDGRVHSMEESDACGTNLWNLRTGEGWDDDLLRIVAGGDKESQELRNKLGPVEVDGGVAAARVSSYLVSKYGLNRGASGCDERMQPKANIR
jgi:xylulokinase